MSQMCRWTGWTTPFYSVAEHTVRVCWRVQRLVELHKVSVNAAVQVVLAGLVHDFHEIWIGDVSRPWRAALWTEDAKRLELQHQIAVADWVGIPVVLLSSGLVKQADDELLATEARDLMKTDWRPPNVAALGETIVPWTMEVAAEEWLLLWETWRSLL